MKLVTNDFRWRGERGMRLVHLYNLSLVEEGELLASRKSRFGFTEAFALIIFFRTKLLTSSRRI